MTRAALVTAVGSTTGLSIIKALRRGCPGLRILGTDTNPAWKIAGSQMVDGFYTVPAASDSAYLMSLERLCAAESVAALFPVADPELMVLAEHAGLVADWGVRLWLADRDAVAMADDKWETFCFFERHQIPVAASWLPEHCDLATLCFPLIVKPRVGVSGRGVVLVHDAQGLQRALEETERPIIQAFLDGPEYTVDVVADGAGQLLGVVPRVRLEVRDGLCYRGATVQAPDLVALCRRIAEHMHLRGPANMQCRRVGQTYRFFEINPRFSGTLPLTVEAGVNGPAMLWRATLGQSNSYAAYRPNVYMARYWQESFRNDAPTVLS